MKTTLLILLLGNCSTTIDIVDLNTHVSLKAETIRIMLLISILATKNDFILIIIGLSSTYY